MIWRCCDTVFDLSRRGLIMGIVNVTPDSFSDGGKYSSLEAAVAHGKKLAAEGADILDIGGESTRPGAEEVTAAEQIRRVVPVIAQLRQETASALSIDTMNAEVAEAAVRAGASIINDVSGLTADSSMAGLVSQTQAGLVIMHMKGRPRTMQEAPVYQDVVAEVAQFFLTQREIARQAGISDESIVYDPGIGFGKNISHNMELLQHLGQLPPAGRPLMLGISRKSFIGKLLGSTDLAHRDWPTVALTAWGKEHGAQLFRVHDVKPNVEALRMIEAIELVAPPSPQR